MPYLPDLHGVLGLRGLRFDRRVAVTGISRAGLDDLRSTSLRDRSLGTLLGGQIRTASDRQECAAAKARRVARTLAGKGRPIGRGVGPQPTATRPQARSRAPHTGTRSEGLRTLDPGEATAR